MMNEKHQLTVLITDYAWPDIEVETNILEAAGYHVVAGPAQPASAEKVEALMQRHQPDAVLFCWAPVTEKAIAASPNLKIAARLGVGLDNLAVDACTERGIWVTNVPDYCVEEVSDHAVAMLLAWARGLLPFDREVRSGNWNPAVAKLRRVADMTIGIVGYGRIGRRTSEKLATFGARQLIHTRSPRQEDAGKDFCDLPSLVGQSDVIILHVPLTSDTHHLFDAQLMAKIRRGALLINVSRGGLVDTDALIAAVESGQLAAVALDVLEHEPMVPEALVNHLDSIITPHVAFSSTVSLVELRRRATEEVVRVLQGGEPEQARNNPTSKG
ncbi:MAG: C-terminal binding protein [Gammaproteobacteria bacterium]|nr:C-terminal binding protein [Gammaproteobacteria bacterium]